VKDAERLEVEAGCRKIAKLIIDSLPSGLGFLLFVFDFGKTGWSTYTSNARRVDMVRMLRELADQLEQRPEYEPPEKA
jgi:hypothetical protein